MISASKTTYSHYNFKILRLKVTKNIKNLRKKFCESPPSIFANLKWNKLSWSKNLSKWELFLQRALKSLLRMNVIEKRNWFVIRFSFTLRHTHTYNLSLSISISPTYTYTYTHTHTHMLIIRHTQIPPSLSFIFIQIFFLSLTHTHVYI